MQPLQGRLDIKAVQVVVGGGSRGGIGELGCLSLADKDSGFIFKMMLVWSADNNSRDPVMKGRRLKGWQWAFVMDTVPYGWRDSCLLWTCSSSVHGFPFLKSPSFCVYLPSSSSFICPWFYVGLEISNVLSHTFDRGEGRVKIKGIKASDYLPFLFVSLLV